MSKVGGGSVARFGGALMVMVVAFWAPQPGKKSIQRTVNCPRVTVLPWTRAVLVGRMQMATAGPDARDVVRSSANYFSCTIIPRELADCKTLAIHGLQTCAGIAEVHAACLPHIVLGILRRQPHLSLATGHQLDEFQRPCNASLIALHCSLPRPPRSCSAPPATPGAAARHGSR